MISDFWAIFNDGCQSECDIFQGKEMEKLANTNQRYTAIQRGASTSIASGNIRMRLSQAGRVPKPVPATFPLFERKLF